MTEAIAERIFAIEQRRPRLVDVGPMFAFAADYVTETLAERTGIRFPDMYFWEKPIDFWHLVLGVKPWGRQREVLLAIRDYHRVAVKAGRRVSKSNTISGVSLNYYCSHVDARVVMTSTTARQVDTILWRQLMMMRVRAGKCFDCKLADPKDVLPRPCPHSATIEGDEGRLARTGLRMQPLVPTDFREIFGFTAKEAEAVQGIQGENVLFLPDESSGIKREIFDAINGNRAAGARVALFGNPTKTEGEFYDAFNEKALDLDAPEGSPKRRIGYYGLTISSRESPNVVEGRVVVPGLATQEWIEECELEWGVDSPLFRVHVLGEFAENEDGKIFSVDAITQAEQRWDDAPEAGRLFFGFDPAGESGMGDESALAPRRGLKLFGIRVRRGLTEEGHLVWLLDACKELRVGREVPVVIMDRDGSVGARLYGFLRGYLESLPDDALPPFELYGVRGSDKPVRESDRYDRQRDATTANFASWIRDGGAIPEDAKLAKEMHVLEWRQLVNGKMKITPKEDIKKEIGRSPDRYDAAALSTWEPSALRDEARAGVKSGGPAPAPAARPNEESDDGVDPFRGGSIDPYGGR